MSTPEQPGRTLWVGANHFRGVTKLVGRDSDLAHQCGGTYSVHLLRRLVAGGGNLSGIPTGSQASEVKDKP
jgi:hypothetical protein